MSLNLRYAAISDRGLIRDGNQDSVFAGSRLLAVADGMGGMAAGDVASNVVIATLAPLDEDAPGADLVDTLRDAVSEANRQLRETVRANPQMEGMGTTLTAMLFSGTRFGMVHVGDSRAYLVRDGKLTQVTKDDSYVQMLVDEGRITPEEAVNHPQRSLITRALQGEEVEPDFSIREAHPGDRYLICSDGLHGFVSHETIGETILAAADPVDCVDRLVQLALRAGGPDNVTVIIADVVDGEVGNQLPIVGGAAAQDRGMTTVADPNSPAARAAAVQQHRPTADEPDSTEPDDTDPPTRRRHPVRTTLIVLIALVVVGGGAFGLWRYTQTQYYVGATGDGHVAVFRGLPGSVLGLHLSSVDVKSGTKLSELTKVVRGRVRQGIDSPSRRRAMSTLRELTDNSADNPNKLPFCPTPSPTGRPSDGAKDSTSARPGAGGRPQHGSSPSTSASPSTSSTPSATPSPSPSPKPGSCRPAK